MTQRACLNLDELEGRLAPAAFGIPWPDPLHLSLSFVPDGTLGGVSTSSLFQNLNASAPTRSWELEILRAFQSWAMHANINLHVLPDGGQALGTTGAIQGDSRFGDLRIAAASAVTDLSGDLAAAQPFSWTGDTWSGDIVLDSSYHFGIGNLTGQYDLYSVAVHEAGHALGFDHNETDPASVMAPTYAYHSGLSASDIALVQHYYGVRQAEPLGNGSMGTATPVALSSQGGSIATDLSAPSDVDYFKFTTPGALSGFTGFTAQIQASGQSLVVPSITVLDAAGRVVSSAVAVDALNNDLTLQVNARPSSTYYVRVAAANPSSVFSVGAYQLNITNRYAFVSLGNVTTITTNLLAATAHTTLGTALALLSQNSGSDERFDYLTKGTLVSSSQTDYFRVQSPLTPSGSPEVMAAIAWGLDVNGLYPRIHVFDANQNPVAVQVLANSQGTYTVQVSQATPGATYYIEACSGVSSGGHGTGNYMLGVDFHVPAPVTFANLSSNVLSQTQTSSSASLGASANELMHFALTAGSDNAAQTLTMTIIDPWGNVVLTLVAMAGQPTVTADVYLAAGTYSVRYSSQTADGSAIRPITFWLDGDVLSDPVGAYRTASDSSGTSSDYTYSSSSSGTTSPSKPYSY